MIFALAARWMKGTREKELGAWADVFRLNRRCSLKARHWMMITDHAAVTVKEKHFSQEGNGELIVPEDVDAVIWRIGSPLRFA